MFGRHLKVAILHAAVGAGNTRATATASSPLLLVCNSLPLTTEYRAGVSLSATNSCFLLSTSIKLAEAVCYMCQVKAIAQSITQPASHPRHLIQAPRTLAFGQHPPLSARAPTSPRSTDWCLCHFELVCISSNSSSNSTWPRNGPASIQAYINISPRPARRRKSLPVIIGDVHLMVKHFQSNI